MPIRILGDEETTYYSQLSSDLQRNLAADYASQYVAQPEIAALLSSNKSRYPWLTAGASLSLAKAGQGPESPLTQQVAQAAAQRRARASSSSPFSFGAGLSAWDSAGEVVGNVFSGIGKVLSFLSKPAQPVVKPTTRAVFASWEDTVRFFDTRAQDIARDFEEGGLGRVVSSFGYSRDRPEGERFKDTSIVQQAVSGKSLGQGFFPAGDAREAAMNAQRTVYDVDGQVGTMGRILASTIFEPGTRPFNALSGALDFVKIWHLDPTNAALRTATAARSASRLIDPRQAPLRTPAQREVATQAIARTLDTSYDEAAGLLRSNTRWTVDDNLAFAWASTGDGARVMDDWAKETSVHNLMKNYKVDIETARRIADTTSPAEARNVFQDRFMAGWLREKPHSTSRPGIFMREHVNSIRLFGSFPRTTQALLSDLDQTASMVVAQGRNARLGESTIDFYINRLARVTSNDEAGKVISDLVGDITRRAAGQVDHTGTINGTTRTLKPGDKVYHPDHARRGEVLNVRTVTRTVDEADPTLGVVGQHTYDELVANVRYHHNGIEQILTDVPVDRLSAHLPLTAASEIAKADFSALNANFVGEIANNTPRTTFVGPDGFLHDLTPAHPYAEYLTGVVTMPNIREVRRITSTYGRLLNNHAALRVPINALDAFRNVWVPFTLLRAAGSIRNVTEAQARLGASGYTSMFSHPIEHVVSFMGKRGDTGSHLRNSEQFQTILAHAGRGNLDRGVQFATETILPSHPEFHGKLADKIVTFGRDPLGQKIAGNSEVVSLPFTHILDDQQMPRRVYHGTNQTFDDFDLTRTGTGEFNSNAERMGQGIYFSADPEYASHFAVQQIINPKASTIRSFTDYDEAVNFRHSLLKDMSEKMRMEYEALFPMKIIGTPTGNKYLVGVANVGEGAPQVRTAYLDMRKPYHAKRGEGNVEQGVLAGAFSDEFITKLKADGYDGIIYKEGGAPAYVVFESKQVHNFSDLVPTQMQPRLENPLKAAQDWYWDEMVPQLRALFDPSQLPAHLVNRRAADRYVKHYHDQLVHYTRSDPGLLEAIARGTVNGKPAYTVNPQEYASITDDFLDYVRARVGQPGTTNYVHAPRPLDQMTHGKLDDTVTHMFNWLWGKPSRYFTENPSLKEAYYERMRELLPQMTREAQDEFIRFAHDALGPNALQERVARGRLTEFARAATRGNGYLTYAEADLAAKIHSTNRARDLLYDLHNRSQFADISRHIFPFFDAWRDMLVTWTKISAHRPQTIRRFQMTVEGARGNDTDPESGFFYIDPQTGNEVFAFPAIPFVTPESIRAATTMTGSVQGLNMFSATPLMPGVGPLVQIPLGHLLPDRPDTDWARRMLVPYGTPTLGGSLTPPYVDKIITAITQDENKDRNYANSVKDAARYLMSTGEYRLDDPTSMRLLEDRARKLAKSVWWFRGLFQWIAPTAPSPDWRAQDPSGQFLSQYKMSQEYHRLVTELGPDDAGAAFLEMFGDKNLLIMQPNTEGYSPASKLSYDYIREHPDVLEHYPDAFKYFAPSSEKRAPYEAYLAALETGTRKVLTYKEWTERANDRVGSLIYYNQKDKMGPKITRAEQDQLAALRSVLTQRFPGFDPESADPKRRDRTIAQFYAAAATNELAITPAGRGIAAYLSARDQAIAKASAAGIKGWESAKRTRNIREWLRQIAAQLEQQYPGFDRAWEGVFKREMVEN